jgi:hypothetical protein
VLYDQLDDLRTAAAQFAGPIAGLTVYAAGRIRGLRPIDVSGYLRFPDGSSAAGATLDVEYQTAGAAWTRIAAAACNEDGSWRTTVQIPASGRLRVVYPGDAVRPRQESPPRRIRILPRLRIETDRARMRRGRVVTVTGTATPADRVSLRVERRIGRRWVRERKRSLAVTDGAFGMRVRLRNRGKYRITARAGGVRRRRLLFVV